MNQSEQLYPGSDDVISQSTVFNSYCLFEVIYASFLLKRRKLRAVSLPLVLV